MTTTYKNALKVTVLTKVGEPWHGVNTYLYQNAALVTHVVSTSQVPASGYSTSQKTSQKGIVIYNDLKVGEKYQVVVANKLDDKKVLSGNSASVLIKQGSMPESTTITVD